MAEDINKSLLVGRLVRDAELMYTNNRTAVCKFSLAVNRSKKQGDQWIEEVNFFDLVMFGRRAESLNQYLVKGTQIAVEGKLRQDRWEQDGIKRSKVIIEVDNIQLLGGKQQGQDNAPGPQGDAPGPQQGPPGPQQSNSEALPWETDDGLPTY